MRQVRRVAALADAARDLAEYAAMGARLSRDLPGYLRTLLTLEDARRRILGQLQAREQRFLRMADTTIYGWRGSPYLRLLKHAGCERGDLHALVRREGLEETLRRLAEAGVYVTYEEFKGRQPAIRGSARFSFRDRDFDNPRVRPHFVELTGGTRGRPTQVRRSLDAVTDQAASFVVALAAHGFSRSRHVYWNGPSPSWALAHFKLGCPVDAWFHPIAPLPPIARVSVGYLGLLSRLAGHRLPQLEHRDLADPEPVARWLAAHARGVGSGPDSADTGSAETSQPGERPVGSGPVDAAWPVVVNTATSSAVRVSAAARSLGLSLAGIVFHCRMEPLTEARRQTIQESGAYAFADYAAVELSSIAQGCPAGLASDDLHLNVNRYVVLERERPVFEGGPHVSALLFTTVSPIAQKIALNVETGDSARIEQRACGCPLGALGLQTHLSEIRSFEKLSSEGTSFVRSNVIQILEETLPARFGGTALDYQLVEEEAADGPSLLVLRVHPSVGELDEDVLLATVLSELGRGGMADRYQARLIERAQSIVVRRLPPLATRGGKVLPFHLARASLTAR